jgi:hypothetical protein
VGLANNIYKISGKPQQLEIRHFLVCWKDYLLFSTIFKPKGAFCFEHSAFEICCPTLKDRACYVGQQRNKIAAVQCNPGTNRPMISKGNDTSFNF